jgi:signal transduction histidine kinase
MPAPDAPVCEVQDLAEPMSRQMMPPRKRAQVTFASAVVLLFLSGLATYVTIVRLLESQKWVVHSHEVQAALGNVDSMALDAGRARSGYALTGNSDFLSKFETAVLHIDQALQHLRELTKDNPDQQNLCTRLETLTASRVALLRESIELKKSGPQDEQGQAEISRRGLPIAADITSTMQQMREEEQRLLDVRSKVSNHLFVLAVVVLMITFILALILFSLHYKLLTAELDAREQAELAVRESEKSLRTLTGRLLQLQDEERRRFSRELHDSLGQYLAAVKMNLDMFSNAQPADRLLSEAMHLLDQSIAETRTISHLLHPPLLDEAGFSSAAKWYLDGFAQRSGIEVKRDFPDDVGRLPKSIELGLFRVLQESLTNIHRHSGSTKAEVALRLFPDRVILEVRDHGTGIPQGLLRNFQDKGTNSGVGLAGMRERLRELGGQLDIRSGHGTLISATMPLSQAAKDGDGDAKAIDATAAD